MSFKGWLAGENGDLYSATNDGSKGVFIYLDGNMLLYDNTIHDIKYMWYNSIEEAKELGEKFLNGF